MLMRCVVRSMNGLVIILVVMVLQLQAGGCIIRFLLHVHAACLRTSWWCKWLQGLVSE